MNKIINLTPHPVTLLGENKEIIRTWEKPSGPLPRLIEKVVEMPSIEGVKITRKEYGECENLPAESLGTYYIVSGLVASALRRHDLLVPNTVRDTNGQIVGCDSFSKIL